MHTGNLIIPVPLRGHGHCFVFFLFHDKSVIGVVAGPCKYKSEVEGDATTIMSQLRWLTSLNMGASGVKSKA